MDNSRRRHLRTSLDFGTSNHVKPLSVFPVGFDVGQGSELQFSDASVWSNWDVTFAEGDFCGRRLPLFGGSNLNLEQSCWFLVQSLAGSASQLFARHTFIKRRVTKNYF